MTKYIIAIVVVFIVVGCETREMRLQSFLVKGNEAFRTGDEEKALYYYSEATKIDPCFVDALGNIGTVHHRAQRYEEAIASYTKGLECNGDDFNLRMNRVKTSYESGEYYAAISDIDILIKKAPDSAMVFFMKGLVLTRLADYAAANKSFEHSLDLGFSSKLDVQINIATNKVSMKQYDEARKDLEACLQLDDKQPNIYNSLALVAIGKEDYNEAIKQTNKALEISPREAYVLNNRGFAYIHLGKLDEAEADINESITIDPYNAWAYRNKGILYMKKKDFVNAERLLLKAKEMDPKVEDIDKYISQVPKTK